MRWSLLASPSPLNPLLHPQPPSPFHPYTFPPTRATVTAVPNTAVTVTGRISRKFINSRSANPIGATYKLSIKGKTKEQRLTHMGVKVTLPAGVTVAKTPVSKKAGPFVTVAGNTVTWFPFIVPGKTTKLFNLRVTMSPPFTAGTVLTFTAEVFHNPTDPMVTTYCPLAFPNVKVNVV